MVCVQHASEDVFNSNSYAFFNQYSTNEGRAILLQDLKAIENGIAQIAPLRNQAKVPAIPFAETYITAYYLPFDDIAQWAKEHPEYLLRHVLALVNVNPQAAVSRTKSKLIQTLEEMDKARRGNVK